ncbi:MAG: hypothetical protein ACJAR3_002000, partial [Roseivirga sp.]
HYFSLSREIALRWFQCHEVFGQVRKDGRRLQLKTAAFLFLRYEGPKSFSLRREIASRWFQCYEVFGQVRKDGYTSLCGIMNCCAEGHPVTVITFLCAERLRYVGFSATKCLGRFVRTEDGYN